MLEYISVVYTKPSYVKFFLAPSIPDTRLSAASARQVGAMEMSPIYIYLSLSLSLSLLPDVKIIHYFLRSKPYFNFEIKKIDPTTYEIL